MHKVVQQHELPRSRRLAVRLTLPRALLALLPSRRLLALLGSVLARLRLLFRATSSPWGLTCCCCCCCCCCCRCTGLGFHGCWTSSLLVCLRTPPSTLAACCYCRCCRPSILLLHLPLPSLSLELVSLPLRLLRTCSYSIRRCWRACGCSIFLLSAWSSSSLLLSACSCSALLLSACSCSALLLSAHSCSIFLLSAWSSSALLLGACSCSALLLCARSTRLRCRGRLGLPFGSESLQARF